VTDLHRLLGLTDEELTLIESILQRAPSHLELAMYAVMWSEHCSYKSSRVHLRRLPTSAPHVLVGPGENAGVVDAGDGVAVAMRIESHNHPSAIEPYQGAATGVGGIIRDIFTMGARPVALMDPLFMGPLDEARSRWIFDGVVRGIAGYGNSVGVPTVGGEITFDSTYAGNPLVNVFCLGVLPVDRLVLGRASGVGNVAVLLGAGTGRDGIGGVSVLASAGFAGESESAEGAPSPDDDAKRPSVQVGDPFEEKRLIEACLALLDAGLVIGIQDLGGAGLSCATSETAARGGVGMDVDVRAVPCREPGMTPVEIMTSESQERMLAIVEPSDLAAVEELCRRWEVTATVVGRITEPDPGGSGLLRVVDGEHGEVLASAPAASLADDAPLYHRPISAPVDLAARRRPDLSLLTAPADPAHDLLELVCDAGWIFKQYDHQLFLNTVVGPGEGDATVLRLGGPGIPRTNKALALSTDSNPGLCAIDPRAGTAQVVAESVLNVACAGARPLALVNCLNFGNPEHPEVMWQLSEAIDGMAEACTAFGVPVVGGNVSLYNETAGADIDPTPVVATLGLIDELRRRPPVAETVEGATLLLIGPRSTELAGSRWARQIRGSTAGEPAQLDFELHQRLVKLVIDLVGRAAASADAPEGATEAGERPDLPDLEARLVDGIHDVSAGGLAVCLAEMCMHSGVGAVVSGIDGHGELFSESPSRVVICTRHPSEVEQAAAVAAIPAVRIGVCEGDRLAIDGLIDLAVGEISDQARARIGAVFA
jgi:phosphoribosylformylglycinamidine synthase